MLNLSMALFVLHIARVSESMMTMVQTQRISTSPAKRIRTNYLRPSLQHNLPAQIQD